MEDVLLEHGDLQMYLEAMTSRLLTACTSLMVALEPLEQHRGRLAGSHLRLESLLSSSVSRVVYEIDFFVNEEVTDHRVRLTGVMVLALYSLELD